MCQFCDHLDDWARQTYYFSMAIPPPMAETPATTSGLELLAMGRLLQAQPCQVRKLLPSMVLGRLFMDLISQITDSTRFRVILGVLEVSSSASLDSIGEKEW